MNERIESLKQTDEPDDHEYENHTLFNQEHDEQLLQWTQRYVQEDGGVGVEKRVEGRGRGRMKIDLVHLVTCTPFWR